MMYNASIGIFPDWSSWCWPPCERFASRPDEKRRRFRGVHGRIERHESRQFSGIIRSFRHFRNSYIPIMERGMILVFRRY